MSGPRSRLVPALLALGVLTSTRTALAAPLAPDVASLPALTTAAGFPTALASADLDGDGVPDLIVAYATGDATTVVAYAGDAEAIYPMPWTVRTTTSPFGTPQALATLPGRVTALTAVDVDADGLKDLVAERALANAAFLAGIGDGTVIDDGELDADTVVLAHAEAAARAPSHLEQIAPRAIAAPDVFRMGSREGEGGGYRPSSAAKHALAHPAKSVALDPPADAFAVLPMRLNADAIPDLVVLRRGATTPELLLSRAAATFVVTTTADETGACDASCSLREALVAANATPDADLIQFAIPTSDAGFQPLTNTWRIQPKGTEYPVVTAPVTIDGHTQPGFAGQPVIELDGGALSEDRAGLIIAASNTVVRGLIVNSFPSLQENGQNFCGCAITISGGSNCIVEGNWVGTDATGLQAKSNGQSGITVSSGQNNLIGGTTAAARNVVSGNREQFFFHVGVGTFISSSAGNNTFAGNYIGLDKTGYNALPNQIGVLLNSANNTIGGTDPGSGNVIAANSSDMVSVFEAGVSAAGNAFFRNRIGTTVAGTGSFNEGFGYGLAVTDANDAVIGSPGNGNLIAGNDYGVFIKIEAKRSTSGHVVQGNTIGADALGRALANNAPGVLFSNVFNGLVGGTGNGEGNLIAFNAGPGVVVNFIPSCAGCTSGTFRSNQNRILSNRIFGNSGRGIDLGSSSFGDGVTANDAGDADTGANDLLNWPVLTSASSTANSSIVNAQALTQGPASGQPLTLQFFANAACDSSGNGEGQIFLGQASRSADGNAVSVNLAVPIPNGYFVTATATDSLGNTSELSNCVTANGGPAPTASATPTPQPTSTPSRTPLPGETPTVAPTNVVGVEVCDNCRDDDGDTIVDRDDPDCPRPRAFGFGVGVATTVRAKAAIKCQAAIAKGGQGLVLKEQKLLQTCLQQALVCVEQKASDPACLAKAGATCQKALASIAKLEDKLEASVEKGCAEPPLPGIDLTSAAGLGFGAEKTTCEAAFVFGLGDANGVARCVHARHRCQVAQLVSQENPRARELLQAVGVSVFDVSSCLANPGANGGGAGVGDPGRAKVLVKCAQGIQKNVAKFAKTRLAGIQKCTAEVAKCVQLKPGDAGCVAKARGKCAKLADKVGDGPKGAGTKARTAIAKACTGADADVLANTGLGQTSTAGFCAAIGVPALTTAADVADCVVRHHACRIGQLVDGETPRTRELLGIVGAHP